MTVYLDTSTVLRVLLRQPKPLAIWARWERAYASELVHVEACRVIDRLRLGGALDDQGVAEAREQLGRIEDAIHLASAMLLRERRGLELSFATHDPQQARAARALGFDCLGV